MSCQVRRSVDVYIAPPGKYSKVDVVRKYVVGLSSVAGTTHIDGSGLKPRRMGFLKTSGSEGSRSEDMVFSNKFGAKGYLSYNRVQVQGQP